MTTSQNSNADLLRAAQQQQFLEVIGRDEAEARFQKHLKLAPLGEETVSLTNALGRVLSCDIVSIDRGGMVSRCGPATPQGLPRMPRAS
jgi:hypothetical protein